MNRRSLLIGLASVSIGGCVGRDQLESSVGVNGGPPETENPINEVSGDGFLKRMILYRSGAARLEFGDDYGCYARIAVGDTSGLRNGNLGEWKLPVDGEMIVNMRNAISKTKDPSNEFWLESIGGENNHCFGMNGISTTFTVPQDWLE